MATKNKSKKPNPRQFFPKIKNSARDLQRKLKEELKKDKNKYPRLNALKFSAALGIINAVLILIITLYSSSTGNLSLTTSMFSDIYGFLGYNISPLGAVLGSIYIFLDTFLITYLFVWIYNKLL